MLGLLGGSCEAEFTLSRDAAPNPRKIFKFFIMKIL
jgi:hypothetical protein